MQTQVLQVLQWVKAESGARKSHVCAHSPDLETVPLFWEESCCTWSFTRNTFLDWFLTLLLSKAEDQRGEWTHMDALLDQRLRG